MSAVRAERMTLFTSASAKTEKKKKLGCWNDGVRRAGQAMAVGVGGAGCVRSTLGRARLWNA